MYSMTLDKRVALFFERHRVAINSPLRELRAAGARLRRPLPDTRPTSHTLTLVSGEVGSTLMRAARHLAQQPTALGRLHDQAVVLVYRLDLDRMLHTVPFETDDGPSLCP